MDFDRPPRITAERSITCEESEISPQLTLRRRRTEVQHLDQTPSKPLRSAYWGVEAEDSTSATSNMERSWPLSTEDDEKSTSLSTVISDITNPSIFSSSTASSWRRQDRSHFSLRSEALRTLREKPHHSVLFEIPDGELLRKSYKEDRAVFTRPPSGHSTVISDITNPSVFSSYSTNSSRRREEQHHKKVSFSIPDSDRLRSSSKDRAVFDIEGKDTPPQLATRLHSRSSLDDLTVDSSLVSSDRFGSDAPSDQDKPMTLPRSSYSQRDVSIIPSAPSALPKLAETFRSGCSTGTHTCRLKKHPDTFVGSEAVDFMLSANLASTREDAVFLGQRFCKELNLFHHVHWDHSFKDGHYFYRFNEEPFTQLSKEDLVKLADKFAEGISPVSKHTRRRFKTYQNTFSGEEAVNFMLQAKLASSKVEAVFLGQRMMEELDIFEPVSHNSRFKDSGNLYRLMILNTENSRNDAPTCFDASTETTSPAESIAQHHQKTPSSGCLKGSPLSSSTIGDQRKDLKVSFGKVQIRCFERRLECNPATDSGPSLGLGWSFCDQSPFPLGDENSGASVLRGRGRLSVEERTEILNDWGFGKADISKATKLNKIIRKQRKRSLNIDTVKHRST